MSLQSLIDGSAMIDAGSESVLKQAILDLNVKVDMQAASLATLGAEVAALSDLTGYELMSMPETLRLIADTLEAAGATQPVAVVTPEVTGG